MRLTNQLRDQIISDILTSMMDKEEKAIVKRENQLAIQCYNHVYSKKLRDTMNALPRGFMIEDTCLRFNICGMNIQLKAGQGMRVPNLSDAAQEDDETVRNYSRRYASCERLGNIADDELKQKYLDLHADQEALKVKRSKIRNDTKAMLDSVQTYQQLEKNWPEGKKFYSKYKPKHGDSQLPAIRVAELNKTLGLVA